MNQIEDFVGNTLTWVQKEALQRFYELQFDGEMVATLRFQTCFGSLADAEAVGARWTIKREGFLTPRITARVFGSDANVAVFYPSLGGGGEVVLAGGARYLWKCTSFWRSEWSFLSNENAPLLQFHRNGFVRMSSQLRVMKACPATTLLALLGWYLVVVTSEDVAATIAPMTALCAV